MNTLGYLGTSLFIQVENKRWIAKIAMYIYYIGSEQEIKCPQFGPFECLPHVFNILALVLGHFTCHSCRKEKIYRKIAMSKYKITAGKQNAHNLNHLNAYHMCLVLWLCEIINKHVWSYNIFMKEMTIQLITPMAACVHHEVSFWCTYM